MQQPLTPDNPAAPGTRSAIAGLVGALLSGIASGGSALAVSCCAGPAIFIALGLGASGATFFSRRFINDNRYRAIELLRL